MPKREKSDSINDPSVARFKNWQLVIRDPKFQLLVQDFRTAHGIKLDESTKPQVILDESMLEEVFKIFNRYAKDRNRFYLIYIYLLTDEVWDEIHYLRGLMKNENQLVIEEMNNLNYPELKDVNKRRGYIDIRIFTNTTKPEIDNFYKSTLKKIQIEMPNYDVKHKKQRPEVENQTKMLLKPKNETYQDHMQNTDFIIPVKKENKDYLGNLERGTRRLRREMADNKK